ncbi:protein translocase subunit SecF [Patescibacteria group bacterium]|nr:protein translocase subunit SecF [Patescibacteria group bacterium]MCG2694575.1 protein translocase subunit SecF [Candidatus Parcubacteria bacterium]
MFVIKYRKIFYTISGLLVGASILAIAFFGINFSIDFTGGAITEVAYPESIIDLDLLKTNLDKLDLGNYTIQKAGENGVILRTKDLTEDERLSVMNALSNNGENQLEEKRFNSIGPVIGEELKSKAGWAILIVVLAIILFIAFAFRKVSELGKESVSSWKYGVVAVLALVHDVIIPTGVFVLLGSIYIDYQIDILFVTALLAILGLSVNDTIVVFDRIRENLKDSKDESFDETVGRSLNQTFARSINTSLTILIVLILLFFFGGDTTKHFALVLSIGLIVGTYSSIFLASPLLVTIQKFQNK